MDKRTGKNSGTPESDNEISEMKPIGLNEEELKALNEQVRKILEEREKLLFDIDRIEEKAARMAKQSEKQSKLLRENLGSLPEEFL